MEVFGVLFTFFWITMLMVGIVKSVKKAQQKRSANLPGMDQPQTPDRHIAPEQKNIDKAQQRWEQIRNEQVRKSRKVAAEGSIENLPHEDLAAKQTKPAASAEKSDGLKLDFNPEEMVIYSEVMKPGYEKY